MGEQAQNPPQEAAAEQVATPEPAPEPTQQIIRRQPKALSQRDPVVIAEHFYRSGFFPDVKSMSQAVVKIIAGEELGLAPMAAMQGLTMIEGKLGMTGNLVATKVRQHETYSYKVIERDNERCKLEFYDDEELLGESEFTVEDAQRAGLVKEKSNWVKYPRAMCFNRALTEGVRAFIPDVTSGTPVYTTEEIEEIIDVAPEVEKQPAEATPSLDAESVQELTATIKALESVLDAEGVNWLDGLNVRLGALGIDAFPPSEPLEDSLSKLTPEQADKLMGDLANLDLEEGAPEADAEQEGGEADGGE